MKPLPSDILQTYRRQGYVVFESLLDDEDLHLLRQVCDQLLMEPPDDDNGGKSHNIGRGQHRRFLRHRHADYPQLEAFVLGPHMKRLSTALLQSDTFLFNEQFVVKGAHTGASFAWHQDSAYVGFDHMPYLTVWIALDDTHEENGGLVVLPRDLDTSETLFDHHWDLAGKELVGYDGDDPGIVMAVSAGSVVAFSSMTLHSSTTNVTNHPRRGYVVQYSAQPIIDPVTRKPKTLARPL